MIHSRPARPSQRRSADRARRDSAPRSALRNDSALHSESTSRTSPSEPGSQPRGVGAAFSNLRPSTQGQELICSAIGLTLKLSLALVAGISLVRLGGAYQQRLDRYGEVTAVLDIQQAKLLKAQNRFDTLFATGGEQRLIQEQDQWIAPNRLRVVWKQPGAAKDEPFPTVERP